MTTIPAQTILRSRNAAAPDKVLSTLLLRYPRFIHAELMTHRAFSRNSASSRAIPVQKMIDDVENDPATPLFWGGNQRGMQAGPEVNLALATIAWQNWDRSRESAIGYAQALRDTGLHKQIVNRILEPYSHITVLVSATEWGNFLELRDHADAEPHIAMLAREIRKCLEREDDIQTLYPGDWHLPFATGPECSDMPLRDRVKLSTARSASTSYKTVEGFDMTLERAIKLHDKLVGARPIHASPAEHVARADGGDMWEQWHWHNPEQHGNFVGFRQYRKQLELAMQTEQRRAK